MSQLTYNLTKKYDQTFIISFINNDAQELNDEVTIFKTDKIKNINNITKFTDKIYGLNDNINVRRFFKYKNECDWSELTPIEEITKITINYKYDFELELFYIVERLNNNSINDKIYINDILIFGTYEYNKYESIAGLNKNEEAVLSSSEIYKIFSIKDAIVYSNHNNYEIKFRFTQDNGLTYSKWENLTTSNISTININKLRFFKIEYLIKNKSNKKLYIYDIILEGEFQNVSANYLKTNRYGLKETCIKNNNNNYLNNFHTSCINTYIDSNTIINELNEHNSNPNNVNKYWNPYNIEKIFNLSSFLGNQISNIFGWNVEYYLTDPDKRGIDVYLHEYTLKNIIDVKKIKILVPKNEFPNENILIDQLNLNLFDTFEIHITKDDFKNTFGIDKRPSEDDIIYFCDANMLYYVKHVIAKRDILNTSTYYKLILKKYEQKVNMRSMTEEIKNKLNELVDNTTLESLFGKEMIDEENKIANKKQTVTLSHDKIRNKIDSNVVIIKEDVFVDNIIFSKYHYNLSDSKIDNKIAIEYNISDNILNKSDNRCIILLIKFLNDYSQYKSVTQNTYLNYHINNNKKFKLIENYDENNKKGYKLLYANKKFIFTINESTYSLNTQDKLLTNVWYYLVINVNQRDEELKYDIYRRNSKIDVIMFNKNTMHKEIVELNSNEYYNLLSQNYGAVDNIENNISSDFENVISDKLSLSPQEYQLNKDIKAVVYGSKIKLSNIRIFNIDIHENDIKNILKENIITDEQNLILFDNANIQLTTIKSLNKNYR